MGDLQKATEWYAKAFKTDPYFNEPNYVVYNIQGYMPELQPENPTSVKIKTTILHTTKSAYH